MSPDFKQILTMKPSFKNKTLKRISAAVLSSVLSVGLLFGPFEASAFAVSQSDIDALKEKRDAIAAQKQEQQAVVDELKLEQADILDQKAALDEKCAYTQEQITLTQEEIDLYNEMIQEKAVELEAAQKAEADQLEKYRTRVRAMEESGGYNILALILKANNLGELLTTMDDVGEIMESDRQLEDDYIAARENTEAVKADYEQTEAELEERKQELSDEQAELEQEIEEAAELIEQYSEYIDINQDKLDEFQAAEDEANDAVNAKIAELEAQRQKEAEEAAAKQAANNSSSAASAVVGSGTFIWPCSCTYITSCVGYRYHPVTGKWKYHSGMDIGASYGDSIWASDSGTVTIAGVNGGYGNCVMIDHGNGYYTLYGHMSSIAVSVGQEVSQGQTIGYVGSTGVSTGPHLHFEIRQGSTCLDSFGSWFSGLTYAPDSGYDG